ncbi:uncharacterized protein ACA1_399810 [Acanthamoeba castellanii str. Neff]|uniref:CHCH domain containing protein n=1 Tax=Acanthamoeba castellanii (strain ATCC 30010 / Neff) TaxID=1257118 RepID=L8GFZ3_ACACF|nr:uncharacterized protein ACA1_399810 [Acanthamoeba castellanii str. Neff]ELR11932.1 hypothetical protein ACA1_399810 [Acanthamoeba castellanii str. Neff]
MAQQRAQRMPIHNPQDNDEFTSLVDQQGCGKLYWHLEDCMNKNERNLIACSKEMSDWRKCYNEFKAQEQSGPAQPQQSERRT